MLRKVRTDPDSQITLRHAATINAINAGDFEKAYRLLGEVEVLLADTTNEDEHRLEWFQHKSVAKMWEGKHAAGIYLTEEALGHVETMSPGCISAWLLINHALFLTKIAADEENINERRTLTKKAERFYQLAIQHAREEYQGQMPHFQSRVPQFAYTGLALLYLGCWESADSSRLGICTAVPPEDIKKARNTIAAVEKQGTGCNVIKFLLTVAKACLQYRLVNHNEAYELARQAKDFATEHSFTNFVKFADNIVQPVGKSPRMNTKTQVTCRKYIDNLAQLSAEGKIDKCHRTIQRLQKVKKDPDFQVSLRHAAVLNAINEGKFEKASCLLGEAAVLLPDTRNEDEHRLRWYHQKSLLKLQQGKHAAGIQLTEEALSLVSIMAPGCISAWLLITHAWFLTKIAADENELNDRRAASLAAIYQGEFEKAICLCRGAKAFIPETKHPAVHRLWGSHLSALARWRTGNYDVGIILAEDALIQSETVASGCITAYPHLNHAWSLTEIAAGEDDDEVRQILMKKAEKEYHHAIEHAERENPNHMVHSKSRVPLFAKIGLALLYLGCGTVDKFRKVSNISEDDITKARNVIAALDKDETIPNSAKCRLMLAKTFLQYRLGSHKLAYDLAQKAKAFATEHSLGRPQRLHKCNMFMIIDNLTPLSAEGKAPKCSSIIAKLQKVKTDPDSQVSLLLAASFNAIYEGPDFEKANRLLHGAKAIIPETQHEAEHRVWLRHVQSVAKLRAGNYKMGIILAEDTLSLLDTVAPGGMTAWVLLNYAWFLTEIAAGEDDNADRQYLMKKTERAYWHAIEHAENEDSMQMLHTQSRESEQILQIIPTGTTNVTDIQGDGNVVVSAGSSCTINLTYPEVVEKPLPRTARLDNYRQSLCRKMLDLLGCLSANGELKSCKKSIDRLIQATPDPDYRAALWTAVAINCINGGNMKGAEKALHHVMSLLDQTENSIEHELGRDHYQSLIYLRENKYIEGERLTSRALCKTEHLQAGCMAAWVLINHGWFYTKMAIQELDPHKQQKRVSVATASFRRATEYSDREFPGQMQDNKSRIRQFALIGQVYLLLRCWRSVDGGCTKPGNTDKITEEDVAKAQEVLISLEKGEPLCAICKVLYHLAKAHLCYRRKNQECLKEAKKARGLAKKGSFKQYYDFANSIVKHFERQVA
ncbi:Hypp2657 [Branchiostoma lanceolatum]|uniref:Hypp2657 protein n=1 Tax=Branchiostoma lanceolatum TaxID=7740 RepID=A0A8J9ZW68_BRALA|nr:Hypp2657 [Branchiostoma lanceolatum]